jgi:hypothetical protein
MPEQIKTTGKQRDKQPAVCVKDPQGVKRAARQRKRSWLFILYAMLSRIGRP